MTSQTTYHVMPSGPGWAVVLDGADAAAFSSREEAIRAADRQAERAAWARVVVHYADRSVEREYAFHGEPRKIRCLCASTMPCCSVSRQPIPAGWGKS